MKPLQFILLLFLFLVKNANCQKLKIQNNPIEFDSVVVLDYVLKGREIFRHYENNRNTFQSRGSYYDNKGKIVFHNMNLKGSTQRIVVKFYNGTKPYITQFGPNIERGIEVDQNTIYESTPGIYNLIVTDSTESRDSIYVNFHMPQFIDLTLCSLKGIELSEYIDFFYTKELIISYDLMGTVDTVSSIKEIPPLTKDQEKIKLNYLDPNTLEKIHSVQVKITNLPPGYKCDDWDECTYNDFVREDCRCYGTHQVDSLKIKVAYSDECFSDRVTLFTEDNDYEQYWSMPYLNGPGDHIKASISKPTTVNLTLKDDKGCELFQEQTIIPKRQLVIETTNESYCNGEGITLSIDEKEIFDKIKWYDEFGNLFDTINTAVKIQWPGKYKTFIAINNCYKSGEVEVKSFSYVDYKINIENNYICDQPEVLRITPSLNDRYNQSVIWKRLSKDEFESNSSNWEVVQENVDSIVISDTGLYSLEVIEEKPHYDQSCKSYDQVVVYGDNSKKLTTQYISNHLKYHEWKFKYVEQTNIPFQWSSEELSSNCSLELNQSKNDIILEKLEDGKRFVLQEQFLKRLNRYGEISGGSRIGGYLIENNCVNIRNIEAYLESIDHDSYRFVCIYYIDKTSTNVEDWMVYVYTKGEYGRFTSLID